MGAWGTGIFDDDVAADLRDDWREAILDGLDPAAATERVLERHRDVLDDADDALVVHLALAAAQRETGRLVPEVRDAALGLIEAGGDVARWEEEDAAAAGRRAKALERLAAKLRGPQPEPKRLRPPRISLSPYSAGDVLRVRGESGSEGLFVVVRIAEGYPRGSTDPVLAPLLWTGGPLPTTADLACLPILRDAVDVPRGVRRAPPLLHTLLRPARDKEPPPGWAEVVAMGVARPDAESYPADNVCTWEYLYAWVGGEYYQRCIELTRRLDAERRE